MKKREPLIIDVTPDKIEIDNQIVTVKPKRQKTAKVVKPARAKHIEKVVDQLIDDCIEETANQIFSALFRR